MREDLLEMVWIIDRSGSMAGLEADTVGGFNAMIAQQRALPGEVYVSTVLFNQQSTVLHDRVPIAKIEPLCERDYVPCGSTALLDALGDAMHHIGVVQKYARQEDVPQKTLFVVTTDGMENASHRYDADEIRRQIRRRQEESGWEFLFLGANIDAIETAHRCGIASNRAVNFHADRDGLRSAAASVTRAAKELRTCGAVQDDWKACAEQDFSSRRRR